MARESKTIVTTIAGLIYPQTEAAAAAVYGLMSDFSAAKRMAFNQMVKDGVTDRLPIERYLCNLWKEQPESGKAAPLTGASPSTAVV